MFTKNIIVNCSGACTTERKILSLSPVWTSLVHMLVWFKDDHLPKFKNIDKFVMIELLFSW